MVSRSKNRTPRRFRKSFRTIRLLSPQIATRRAAEQIEKLRKEVEKARREAASFRAKLREIEPEVAKATSVGDQLAELRKTMAERDVADIQRNGRLAAGQVQAKLAEAGLSAADMDGVVDDCWATTTSSP